MMKLTLPIESPRERRRRLRRGSPSLRPIFVVDPEEAIDDLLSRAS